jgi:hypothetical protein
LYLLPEDAYGSGNKENECYDAPDYKAVKGLQNISPCQYGKLICYKAQIALTLEIYSRGSCLHIKSTFLSI